MDALEEHNLLDNSSQRMDATFFNDALTDVDEDFMQEERADFWLEESQRPKNFNETVTFYKKLLYLTGDKTYLMVLISLNSFKIR